MKTKHTKRKHNKWKVDKRKKSSLRAIALKRSALFSVAAGLFEFEHLLLSVVNSSSTFGIKCLQCFTCGKLNKNFK